MPLPGVPTAPILTQQIASGNRIDECVNNGFGNGVCLEYEVRCTKIARCETGLAMPLMVCAPWGCTWTGVAGSYCWKVRPEQLPETWGMMMTETCIEGPIAPSQPVLSEEEA